MVKLVNAVDLKSADCNSLVGSSPTTPTIYIPKPILSKNQEYFLEYISNNDYVLKKTKKSYGIVGEELLSISLRSLLKRKIISVIDGRIIYTDDIGWYRKRFHYIDMDDVLVDDNEVYRIYKVTDYSCYGYCYEYDKNGIWSRWISKNDLIVYSRKDISNKVIKSSSSGRYQKSYTRGKVFT